MQDNDQTRRSFLKIGAAAATSFFIVPRHVLGKGYTAPSDKLNIMGIGGGGKGFSDIEYSWKNGAENIVAVTDVDDRRCADIMKKLPANTKKYRDFRIALEAEKNNIDAVIVSTPDHTHATIAMAAMSMGKHVYVQKPLSHDIYEARIMAEAARKYKVVSQMGNQGSSGDGVRQMVDWFDAGLIGKVSTVHVWTDRPVWPQGIAYPTAKQDIPTELDWDLWLGPAPMREYNGAFVPFKWRGWWDYGTGALGDMGCHLMEPPYRVLGLSAPTEVECNVGSVFSKDWVPDYIPQGCPPSSMVRLKFNATPKNKVPVTLNWYDGGLRPMHPEELDPNVPMGEPDGSNGVLMIGTKGIMTCGIYGKTPKVFIKGKQVPESELPKAKVARIENGDNGHNYHWVKACKEGFGSAQHLSLASGFDYAGPFTETVLMGNLAIRSYMMQTSGVGRGAKYDGRKKLLWDGDSMKITNFEAANQFVKREYREGWKL
jgi:predicted dehydrogenase